jgi:hypothetical protein
MTQEIIQMARDSGMELYGLGKDRARFVHHLEAFAKLIAEAEREACAKLAEQYGPNRPIVAVRPSERIRGRWEGEQAASSGISAAIRARGDKHE